MTIRIRLIHIPLGGMWNSCDKRRNVKKEDLEDMMFLIWIVLLVILFLFYNKIGLRKGNDPLTILKQRLAKGEISIDEYEKAKQEIM
jgi:hypothetical protein